MIRAGLLRLDGHRIHAKLAKKELRKVARNFEELSNMSRLNAESATWAALGPHGGPLRATRREAWLDSRRLLERSAALGEIASAIRCELAAAKRGAL